MSTMTEATPTTAPTHRWTIDPSHSSATFTVKHMMITNVRGEFQKLSGDVVYDPNKLEASKVNVSIDVASINTREEKRDAHLRSADFFDVENFPAITFASKAVRRNDKGFDIVGDLTIHGTSREVTLTVDELTAPQADPWGNQRMGATAHTKIRRSEFGMVWNAALEAGGVLVGDEIKIAIDVSLIKSK